MECIKEKNLPIDTFLIDDGWMDYIGDYNPNNKFPSLDTVVNTIRSYHLNSGIWTSPFIVDKNSSIVKEHKEWLLKDINNKLCIFKVNKTNYYVIDITIKETTEYFKELYSKLYNIGFRYFKIDFTRAPFTVKNPCYSNKYVSVVEAYVNQIKAIRDSVKDSYILLCGGLYDPLIGIVDGVRTSKDTIIKWRINKTKSIEYNIKQNIYRYYYNYWFKTDPDSLAIRKNKIKERNNNLSLGLLSDEEIKCVLLNNLISSSISISERLDTVSYERLNNINKLLPKTNLDISIPHYLSGEIEEVCLDNEYKIIFNFSNNIKKYIIDESFVDFYSAKRGNVILKPHSATILKKTNKEYRDKFIC